MPDHQTDYDGIIIRCTAQDLYFPMMVKAALATIASKPLGRTLLKSIEKRSSRAKFGYTVCIVKPGNHGQLEIGNGESFQLSWTNKAVRVNELDASDPTKGTPTAVYWNPNITGGPDGQRPPFIGLAHELIHAMNNLRGTAIQDVRNEEFATVGLGHLAGKRKRNENAIRAEHGIAARTSYQGL